MEFITGYNSNAELLESMDEIDRGLVVKLKNDVMWIRFIKDWNKGTWIMQALDPFTTGTSEPREGLTKEDVKHIIEDILNDPELSPEKIQTNLKNSGYPFQPEDSKTIILSPFSPFY